MVWTGVGTLPGIGLIAVGLDQIATGSINLRYGRVAQGFSILEFGVYRATGSETAAFLAPGVFGLGLGTAGSLGRLGVRGAGAVGELTPSARLTWQYFLPIAKSRLANSTAIYGSDVVAMARAPRITSRWLAREISNPRFATGCEDVARQIQKLIGGDVIRLMPQAGIPMLGAYRGHFPFWFYHEVVLKNGRVYDLFTGFKGLTVSEFKQLWSSARWIEFGF